jgi:hypothetical protein
VGEQFAAKAGVFIDFEHVEAEVGDAGFEGDGDGLAPGGGCLVRKSGDEVEVEVKDAGGAEASDLAEADLAGVKAADGTALLIVEALDAEADTVEAEGEKGVQGGCGELAGGALDGDLGLGGEGEGFAQGGEDLPEVLRSEVVAWAARISLQSRST